MFSDRRSLRPRDRATGGSRHRHAAAASRAMCRIAADAGWRALEGAAWMVAGSAGQNAGHPAGLHPLQRPEDSAGVRRYRPHQVRNAGRPHRAHLRDPVDLYGFVVSSMISTCLGRTYRVTAQADNPYRLDLRDVAGLKTRNVSGEMVPIGSVASFSDITGAYRVSRATTSIRQPRCRWRWRAAISSGEGIAAIEKIARGAAADPALALNGPRLPCNRNWPGTLPSSLSDWPWSSSTCCLRRCTKAGSCR